MTSYLYRRGDGNDGDFPRAVITLAEDESPYAALRALVENDYIAGRRVRLHIRREISIELAQFVNLQRYRVLHAVVYEGPDGERAFGAAWLTATLEPLSDTGADYYRDTNLRAPATLRDALDNPAWRVYCAHAKE